MVNKKRKIIVKIDGMHCEHCAKKVENGLSTIDGILKVKVDIKNKIASIYTSNCISSDIIRETIENLDYRVLDIIEK